MSLLPRVEQGVCHNCGSEKLCIVLQVASGGGIEDTAPTCIVCLGAQANLDVLIEQPDMRPGARPPDQRLRRRSRKQELDLAADTGGRRHRGSGAMPGLKSDGRKKGVYRAESKLTKSKSFTLTQEVLDKIRSETDYNEVPVVDIMFVDRDTLREKDRWVCIPYTDFEEKIANAASGNRR